MSRVNIDALAFVDHRFAKMASLMAIGHPLHAVGRMAAVWLECTLRETDRFDAADLDYVLGYDDAANLLCECDLAEYVDKAVVRIKGCVGRTDWLEKKRASGREHGKKGGRPAKRVTLSGKGRKQKGSPLTKPNAAKGSPFPKTGSAETPPAPAPAPAPSPTNNPLTPQRGDVEIVIDYLNEQLGNTGAGCFKHGGKARELIEARLEDYTVRQLKMVCWHRQLVWGERDEMVEYLRPSTLFRKAKFEEYLPAAEAEVAKRERDKPDPHKVRREDYEAPAALKTLR